MTQDLNSELYGSTSNFFRHFLDVGPSNDFNDDLLEECTLLGIKCEDDALQEVPTSNELKQKVSPPRVNQSESRQINHINMIVQDGLHDNLLQDCALLGIQYGQHSFIHEISTSNEVKHHTQLHRAYEAERRLNNMNMTDQEKQWQREVEAERRRDRLARETEEQRRRRLDRDRLRNWKKRQFESAEQKQDRRARDRIRHRLKRCTNDKIAHERDRLKKQMNRQRESIEEKQERRARDRLRHQLKRWTQNRIPCDKKSSSVDSR